MEKYLVLGIGSKSDMGALECSYPSLGGKKIGDYLKGKGIRHLPEPLLVSCHRTLERACIYAMQCENLAATGSDGGPAKVVVVLFGGLSFALPGIFSSETTTVPVIGVPAYAKNTCGGGLDAATAVYNLPPGTVVGGAPLHSDDSPSLDKAVLIAEKMLTLNQRADAMSVTFITPGDSDKATLAVKALLDSPDNAREQARGFFGVGYRCLTPECAGLYDLFEVLLNVTYNNHELRQLDGKSMLAFQSRISSASNGRLEGYADFSGMVENLGGTKNTLYFGSPENAALFLVRTLALHSLDMRRMLGDYRQRRSDETAKRYGPGIDIRPEVFK